MSVGSLLTDNQKNMQLTSIWGATSTSHVIILATFHSQFPNSNTAKWQTVIHSPPKTPSQMIRVSVCWHCSIMFLYHNVDKLNWWGECSPHCACHFNFQLLMRGGFSILQMSLQLLTTNGGLPIFHIQSKSYHLGWGMLHISQTQLNVP